MQILLEKAIDGSLRPATPEDAEKLSKIKAGTGIRVELKRPRNYNFLKKTMVLFSVAYDYFVEHGISEVEYKGRKVVPCRDRFRKDLTILAGHYRPVFRVDGVIRLEASSLSYAKCSEEQAERIYQDVITTAIEHVYRGSLTGQELDDWVERLIRFG